METLFTEDKTSGGISYRESMYWLWDKAGVQSNREFGVCAACFQGTRNVNAPPNKEAILQYYRIASNPKHETGILLHLCSIASQACFNPLIIVLVIFAAVTAFSFF